MKKLIAFILTGLMVVSLTACGSTNSASSTSVGSNTAGTNSSSNTSIIESTSESVTQSEEQQTETTEENVAENTTTANSTSTNNMLVVYFTAAQNSDVDAVSSASVTVIYGVAKGNVQAVADEIAAYTGADLFSIRTSVEYPGDIDELIDYALDEQDADERPELTTHIENLDQYVTIFIGYPTWWYDLPQVMYSFFDEYDFSGKIIIPFNSANGSRFSGTIGTIQSLEPNATVITDGLSVHHNNIANAKSEGASCLKGLVY
jgi:flavodoxin